MIFKSSMGLIKSRCDIFSGTTQGWVFLGILEEDEGIIKGDDKKGGSFWSYLDSNSSPFKFVRFFWFNIKCRYWRKNYTQRGEIGKVLKELGKILIVSCVKKKHLQLNGLID
jgi:hypothetical protein